MLLLGKPIIMASTSSNKIYASTVGRRKTSTVAVRIIAGKGEVTVNGKPAADYFGGVPHAQVTFSRPLAIAGLDGKYAVMARASGGGVASQLDALVLGISRGLVDINEKHKPDLRAAGFMTRDPRKRQRRMVGTGGKARRRKQSPKR